VKPFSVLELDIPAQFIHGNGDREVLARMSGVESDWYRTAPGAAARQERCARGARLGYEPRWLTGLLQPFLLCAAGCNRTFVGLAPAEG
jgi:hypothetical protein